MARSRRDACSRLKKVRLRVASGCRSDNRHICQWIWRIPTKQNGRIYRTRRDGVIRAVAKQLPASAVEMSGGKSTSHCLLSSQPGYQGRAVGDGGASRNQKFESISLQRRVRELSVPSARGVERLPHGQTHGSRSGTTGAARPAITAVIVCTGDLRMPIAVGELALLERR